VEYANKKSSNKDGRNGRQWIVPVHVSAQWVFFFCLFWATPALATNELPTHTQSHV